GTEFHRGSVEDRSGAWVAREQRLHVFEVPSGRHASRSNPVHRTCDDSPSVRIYNRVPLKKSKRGNCSRGVRADAGEAEQRIDGRGNLIVVLLSNLNGGTVQPERPAWVSE